MITRIARHALHNWKITAVFLALSIIYILQTLFIPVDNSTLSRLHIGATTAKLLSLTVVLPYVVIWFVGLYGYLRFKRYVRTIHDSDDGRPLRTISLGLLGLALFMPLAAVISNAGTLLYHARPDLTANIVRFSAYSFLLLSIYPLFIINRGAKRLAQTLQEPHNSWRQQLWLAAYVIMSVLYVYGTLHNPARAHAYGTVKVASFYLNDWFLVFTIVIPYLVGWFCGFRAMQHLHRYGRSVDGVLYRSGLSYIANGIGFVVLSTIAVRYISSLAYTLNSLELTSILLIIYSVLFLIGVGYWVIAVGARKLQLIEEV